MRLATLQGEHTGMAAMKSPPMREYQAETGAKACPGKIRKGLTSVACWAPKKKGASTTWPWALQRAPEPEQVV